MNKRSHQEANGHSGSHSHNHHQHKKHKQNHRPTIPTEPKEQISYQDALSQLPPPTAKLGHVPPYTHFTITPGLPPLPRITNETLRGAPFKHKSMHPHDRSLSTTKDVTYEKLEFLGDAQLEHIASRLIYERYPFLPAGQQSQLRELLVKNETLSEYARLYGFDQQVKVTDLEKMMVDGKDRGNKGFNKVLGDVFEAYLAAVIIDGGDEGFAVVEKWMTALWAPKLVEAGKTQRFDRLGVLFREGEGEGEGEVYDPTAKAELQRRIAAGPEVRLEYEAWKKAVELKGDLLGQNLHFIALYLTGYGYERMLLGKGEGRNKVEAGNWAATKAMHGECKGIVEECEKILMEKKAAKKAERARKDEEKKAKADGDDQDVKPKVEGSEGQN